MCYRIIVTSAIIFYLPGFQNSIFTFYLLEGFRGSHEALDKQGVLTPAGLFLFLYKNLTELNQIKQEPIYHCTNKDIELCKFPEYRQINATSTLLTNLENHNEFIISNGFKNSSNYINQFLNSPQLAKSYYLQGMSYINEKKFPEAITSFSHAFDIDNNLIEALVAKGICFGESHDYVNAREQFNLALKQVPYDSLILYNIGLSYILEQDYVKGMKVYKQIVHKDGSNVDGLLGLGTCFARNG